jgi:drug/metabolite transporter (DMT)-like permease
MPRILIFTLTSLSMIAFAANSLFCRMALKHTAIDAASFASIRIISAALALWLILRLRGGGQSTGVGEGRSGSWPSALALFVYVAGFSFAYISLPAGTGALLLAGTMQASMIGWGLWCGERLGMIQTLGMLAAMAGLVGLMLPGVTAPPMLGSVLMLCAGAAWGVYSLRGKAAGDPVRVTAGNFLRALPLAAGLSLAALPWLSLDAEGVLWAVLSGAVTSGAGYVVWYTALRGQSAFSAATVQLSVPVITAIGGVLLLGEVVTLRLAITSVAILGGITLVALNPRPGQGQGRQAGEAGQP